jgi:hypothetical protein
MDHPQEQLDRAHRRLARGTREDTPARALTPVGTIIALAVGVVTLIAVLVWALV